MEQLEDLVNARLGKYPGLRQLVRRSYQALLWNVAPPASFARLEPGVSITPVCRSTEWETFFGYFGFSPWNEDMTQYLVHRLAPEDNACEICVVDTEAMKGQVLARTEAFNVQQGAMLRWFDNKHFHFNTITNGTTGAVMMESDSGRVVRTYSRPIFESHPGTGLAFSLNPYRLTLLGEYGYQNLFGAHHSTPLSDHEDGIWAIDMYDGTEALLVSVQDLRQRTDELRDSNTNVEINHLLCNPSGTHLVFMQRWYGRRGRESRLWLLEIRSGTVRRLTNNGVVSHYSWRTDEELLVWMRDDRRQSGNLYSINISEDKDSKTPLSESMVFGDTHPSFSPCGRWIVLDSYPDRHRVQALNLYDVVEKRLIPVARFVSPLKFDGSMRCDLHPRWSPDGRCISIDSCHEGRRGNYILDVSQVVAAKT